MSGRIPSDIEHTRFDVIIIGAGINGAGIARDAAMRGLKVLLLDKGDIAGGTTSYSTRLIHGGLRYLEHGEVGLVRESLRERERLFHTAPHLVRPLPILIPIYAQGRRGWWTIRAGMTAYDLLSFDKSLKRYSMITRAEALRRVPALASEGLHGAAIYHDAQVEYAERLVVENALSAYEHGAVVLTYARVDRLITEGGAVSGVEFTDSLGSDKYIARAPVIVNVAGPWVDQVLASLAHRPERMIGGTKGSHLIVDQFPGAPDVALYAEALEDGRPFFIIPWTGKYLIGTTDIKYDGDPDNVEADGKEIDYLIRETNRILPAARLARDSILYTYSGVRPLPYVNSRDEKGATRRHFIHDHAPDPDGLISIIGGKLTTYRNLSEQTVDLLFRKLGRRSPDCMTAREALPGAAVENFAAFGGRFKRESLLPVEAAGRLLRIYGTRASEILKLDARDAELKEPFDPETGAIGAEILISFRHEFAQTLGDCLLRRTMVGLGPSVGLGADRVAARVAQKYLGWSRNRTEQEVAAYRRHLQRYHPRNMPLVEAPNGEAQGFIPRR